MWSPAPVLLESQMQGAVVQHRYRRCCLLLHKRLPFRTRWPELIELLERRERIKRYGTISRRPCGSEAWLMNRNHPAQKRVQTDADGEWFTM